MKKSILLSIVVLLGILPIGPSVFARSPASMGLVYDPITGGAPGTDVLVTGEVTNFSSTPITLLTDSFTVDSGPGTLDDTVFFDDVTLPYFLSSPVVLGGGDSLDLSLFDIDIDPAANPGDTITGLFDIQGQDPSLNPLDTGDTFFTVPVVAAVTSTPEPSGIVGLSQGAIALVWLMLAKRRSSKRIV